MGSWGDTFVTGAGADGAGRYGMMFGEVTAPPGGLGAGLAGTRASRGYCGIGGALLGFSKLPSWFDGNLGLCGGLITGLISEAL